MLKLEHRNYFTGGGRGGTLQLVEGHGISAGRGHVLLCLCSTVGLNTGERSELGR